MSEAAWRMVCDCDTTAEGLSEADAIALAQEHTDRGHSPAITAA